MNNYLYVGNRVISKKDFLVYRVVKYDNESGDCCLVLAKDYDMYCKLKESERGRMVVSLPRKSVVPCDVIRFIDSHYNALFYVNSKGVIRDQKNTSRVLTYIDEVHFFVDGVCYHSCQYAELCNRNGLRFSKDPEHLALIEYAFVPLLEKFHLELNQYYVEASYCSFDSDSCSRDTVIVDYMGNADLVNNGLIQLTYECQSVTYRVYTSHVIGGLHDFLFDHFVCQKRRDFPRAKDIERPENKSPYRLIRIYADMEGEYCIIGTDATDEIIETQLAFNKACLENGEEISDTYSVIRSAGYVVNEVATSDELSPSDLEDSIIDAEFNKADY